jgi:PAS domain-containing protein
VASIISSVKTNIRTAALLAQSQEQADELAQHEEEMRQNLEEMQATQEEAAHRHDNLTNYTKALKANLMVAELDIKGRMLEVSPELTVVYGSSVENMRNKYYDAFVAQDENSRAEFNQFWEALIKNGAGKRMQKLAHRNKEIWLLESYFVIEKEDLRPKVLLICTDKTKEVELNQMLRTQMK